MFQTCGDIYREDHELTQRSVISGFVLRNYKYLLFDWSICQVFFVLDRDSYTYFHDTFATQLG